MPEYKGDLFQRPDETSNLKYAKILDPDTNKGWGAIFTPDELRRIWMFGNSKLTTMSGDQYSDEMLAGIIEQYTLAIQEELQHDILPVQWRHRPEKGVQSRDIEDYARWQDLLDYKVTNNVNNNFHVRVKKPIIKVQKFVLQDPYSNNIIVDLLPYSTINHFSGEVRSTFVGMFPGHYNTAYQTGTPLAGRMFGMRPGLSVPNALLLDYQTGYDKASRVPKDLVNFIQKIITIHILSRYGTGIVGGLANFSVSAGVISESVGTTMSASIDYSDKVFIRKKYRDNSYGEVYEISIGDFFKMFQSEKNITDYSYLTIAVNPKDIAETGWKEIYDAVEHCVPKKKCYRIYCGNLADGIGITEDHSLFRIENGRLFEVKGVQLSVNDSIAVWDRFGKVYSLKITKKESYTPKDNKMYDLSVKEWENFVVNERFIAHNTSAYFGADILQFQNELKEIYPKIVSKYTGIKYAIL